MAWANPSGSGTLSVLTGLRGAVVIVRPAGELTMSTAPYFHARLEQAAAFNTPPRVVVDTEEITYCDSAGLRGLYVS
ncbi:hypothetical protein GCM10014719_71420 [Planomonospora parontospora subsp. antibiotica]|uniref:STAS domain-containing protein n=1 Tax=Planomonospora parontospora TaxID=58119 RepID=UPI0019BF60C7|nr:STAS domain-containing protein [Planomonospora parontospora]GGL59831.1 hypothetical protein GCM10014719_71420 [Planomonospora parontospora subsp. antibiotica]